MYELIETLKQKQWLWQGSQTPESAEHNPTGYDLLDRKLQGGFPKHGVVELQGATGIGELRLLLPHLKITSQQRLSVFIQPPGYLCAEQLANEGLDCNQLLIIYPKSDKQALWAAEQCLRSGACSNVLLWHPELEVHQARRLQIASEYGHSLQFLFKTANKSLFSLPVSLSMTLLPHALGIEVTITKRKGGWPQGSFVVELGSQWPSLTLRPQNPVVIPFPLRQQG
ncbi:translesion DNA synthesis-associated protein ImuA [Vibrio sp. JPW-9-11-11]|uniref:translesion DNA synthesis-associated protein ImuA n=1 Tax=Vibrio sp. JPW-9-11-11 TaxID=1416532 RepID=UPI0015938B57|nr:translesion DNA synthesis-associated protein ImuA [Vibrio sp. JPW-9-11-11]NVD07015.1 translesion DNA synthesis-associated protein ImuA [Vibrio sp. JPW-9-11-11]